MKYDFIFDVIRNKDFADYYKSLNLTVFQLEAIIRSCHKPLSEKLLLLKKFEKEVDDEYKKDIGEMIKLYEIMISIYKNPRVWYGNDTTPLYLCGDIAFKGSIAKNINNDYDNMFKTYLLDMNCFDSLNSLEEYKGNCDSIVDIYIIKDGKLLKDNIISYKCFIENGSKCTPYYCQIYDKITISDNSIKEAINRYLNLHMDTLDHIGIPYLKQGTKVKFKLPGMIEPCYGIMDNELDYNHCWYNFMHITDNINSDCNFIDLSYNNIENGSEYAVFDWVEKA